ncbi:hypothetical protein B4168_3032 [Anoxybacillus flavithermus]|nr:hypothetical protein B4168_3032 [Anoxybacillus flavithermus]
MGLAIFKISDEYRRTSIGIEYRKSFAHLYLTFQLIFC